jgi:hypothetical protein
VVSRSPTSTRTNSPDGRAYPAQVGTDVVGLWRLVLTLVLSVATPLYLVASTDEVGRSSAWIFALPVIVWSGWRLARLISSGTGRYGALMFWIFNYIFFGLAVLVQVRTGLLPGTNVLPEFDERAMLVVLASLVAFEIGGALARSPDSSRAKPLPRNRRISARVVAIFCWSGLLMSWAYIGRVGITNVIASRFVHSDARNAVWPDPTISAVAYALAFVPLLVAAHLLLLCRRRADLVSAPSTRWGLALLVFSTLAVVVNLFGTARFIFGAVWLSVLVQLGIAKTERARRAFSLAILVGFIFVFPIADKFSRQNASGKKFRALEVFQGNGDYDAFAQVNNSLNMVAHVGRSYGRQLLGVLCFWVPRSVWPGKPDDTAIVISEFMGYKFTNLSAPLVSELYVNGGPIVVVAGFAAIGFMMSRSGGANRGSSAELCIFACVAPFYSPILLRGSLLQATGFAVLFGLCVLVLRWVAKEPAEVPIHAEVLAN